MVHLMTEPHSHDHHHDHDMGDINSMALAATLHCLTGCAIGEILGLVIGTAAGLASGWTIAISVALAFFFGYTLSTFPLLRSGLAIATMEVVDNLVVAVIPGAMDAGLVNDTFWISMMLALTAAFVAAFPVNRYLLQRGKGHALTHEYHHGGAEVTGARRFIPAFSTGALVSTLVAFMVGGLLVSIAEQANL
jgi:hypothetical protein